MWLVAANLVFMAGGLLLYLAARRQLFLGRPAESRNHELAACGLFALLAVGGFALAHVGMNASWTGRARVSDLTWLGFALICAGAVFVAHLVLRWRGSRADQLVLPVAAFLALLGLVNIYVWETRDANSYVSTVALPALREFAASVADDPLVSEAERREILAQLGPVPNELLYEDGGSGRSATVQDSGWLDRYNAAARRFESLESPSAGAIPVREVRLHEGLRRQVIAFGVAVLLVPAVILALGRVRLRRFGESRLSLAAAGLLPLGLVGAALASTGSRDLPPLLSLGGQTVTVFELLKLGLIGGLALALAHLRAGANGGTLWRGTILAAIGVTVAAMVWRDTGAGIALLAVATLMLAASGGPRRNVLLIAAAVALVGTLPLTARVFADRLPGDARVRLEMWSDPWGSFERAEVHNLVSRSIERLADIAELDRTESGEPEPGAEVLVASRSANGALPIGAALDRVEQELSWRLDLRDSGESALTPLVPQSRQDEELLLLAEELWASLGGFDLSGDGPESRQAFEARIREALRQLDERVDQLEAGTEPGTSLASDNFQLQRSLYALRAGGVIGVGLGQGRPEAIPAVTEDVALASLGEAFGLAGVGLVVLFVLLLAGRGIQLGQRQRHPVVALLLIGLASLLGLQALVSLGGLSGVLPFTGLTFPLVSRSGTGLVVSFVALALIAALAARSGADGPTAPEAGLARKVLGVAGLPLAFALVVASVAVLQLTGRMLTPGPVLSSLPDRDAAFLHAGDQWGSVDYRAAPGQILDRDGHVLVETTSLGGPRVYPDLEAATSLGHTLERLDLEFGEELRAAWNPDRGSRVDLVTTIDVEVQKAVAAAIDSGAREGGLADIESLRGAVVLLDATDGSILALGSRPTFSLAELEDPRLWARAEAEERRSGFAYRHLNRVTNGLYPPGSAFKAVTAAAVLDLGLHRVDSQDFDYRADRQVLDERGLPMTWHQLELRDGPPIVDGNHPHVSDWLFSLEEAFAYSGNVAFAEMGLQLGPADLVDYARRFGFEQELVVEGLGGTTSSLDNDPEKEPDSRFLAQTDSNLARTAFGQAQVIATPLQMALVPAAVANGGEIMEPHVVAGRRSTDGTWIERYKPRILLDSGLAEETVAGMRQIMEASVTYGLAGTARLNPENADPGVAGKTGSAEWSDDPDSTHSWFIGYFPAESPRLALAVVVERGGPGPRVAARIAKQIFGSPAVSSYLERVGVE